MNADPAAAAAALLPALIAIPLVGAVLVMFIPRGEARLARGVGLAFALIAFVASLAILGPYQTDVGSFQLVFDKEWIGAFGAHFRLGIDGISLWLVILTTFLMPIVLLSAHKSITTKVREFVAILLVLEAGMLGAFLALDLFLFYVFWEIMLIPMYLLIGIWGGQRRLYASIKFVIYTMVGSLLMLAAIFYVYAKYGQVTGTYTTDFYALRTLALPYDAQMWLFGAFALAFAIKVPLFPLHTWLPDAHVEAPTAGSVVLAGVLLKFGVYGFVRFAMPLFPHAAAEFAPYMAVLAVAGIIYGAFVAFAQEDVKKLIAYSSVSHLGFCILGLFALTSYGISGSLFAMISHGLTTSGLFLAVGVIYERRHTRKMAEFGGLWKQMPVFGALFLICVLGSAGLPGLSGFVGEFLTIFGTFLADSPDAGGIPGLLPYPMLLAALAATGVIFGAVYLLYMFQKVMFGPLSNEKNKTLPDVTAREVVVFAPIVIGIFVLGLFPKPVLEPMEASVDDFVSDFKSRLKEPDGPAHIRGQASPSAKPNAAAKPGTNKRVTINPNARRPKDRAGNPRGNLDPRGATRVNPDSDQGTINRRLLRNRPDLQGNTVVVPAPGQPRTPRSPARKPNQPRPKTGGTP